jgi:hypothetical protein
MIAKDQTKIRNARAVLLAGGVALSLAACSAVVPPMQSYAVRNANGTIYDPAAIAPPYPPLYTYQTSQPRPAPPPQFRQPDLDNGSGSDFQPPPRIPPVAVRPPEPSAPRDDDPGSGSSTPPAAPQPVEPHVPPPNVEAGSPRTAPPHPPGEYCGWWDVCHLWE